jgi:type I restriction enzyme S subunit
MKFERLGNIAEIKTGKYDVNHSTNDGQYTFYTCAMGQFKSPTFSFQGTAIILPGNGANVGQVFFSEGNKFEAYQRTYVIQNIKANPNYVYYYFKVFWKRSLKNSQYGSATNYIRMDNITDFEIPLPSLSEQIQIANILSKAETLIEQRKKSIDLLDEFLKSTFLEMFGDPVTNDKGWEKAIVKDLLHMPSTSGHYVPKEQYSSNGVEMVHMSDLFYNVVPRGKLKRVLISEREIEKYRLTEFDLLIARRSLTFEGAAKACLIPKSQEPLVFESSMIRLSPNLNKVLPLYLFYYLNNDRAKSKYVLKHITKSTISGINQTNLNKIEVTVPPIELQTQFATMVTKTEALKEQYRRSLLELENLYGALSQKAFKGELEFTNQNQDIILD